MSERTFSRRFHAEVGLPPKRWLLAQRVHLARELLETTDQPVEQIAASAGFPSPTALRKHLRRHVATTPTAYRRAFRDRVHGPGRGTVSTVEASFRDGGEPLGDDVDGVAAAGAQQVEGVEAGQDPQDVGGFIGDVGPEQVGVGESFDPVASANGSALFERGDRWAMVGEAGDLADADRL